MHEYPNIFTRFKIQRDTQSFSGHTGTYTGTGMLMKVSESAPSGRQTDEQKFQLDNLHNKTSYGCHPL